MMNLGIFNNMNIFIMDLKMLNLFGLCMGRKIVPYDCCFFIEALSRSSPPLTE